MKATLVLLSTALAPALATSQAEAMMWKEVRASVQEEQAAVRSSAGVETCTMTDSEPCALADMTTDGNYMVYPGGETRCIFNPNLSGDFAFQVVPGAASDKLLFFFQGGGACWDKLSTEVGACTTSAEASSLSGLFDHSNELNPFKDYTVVNVLYCSGDVHAGNVTRPYNDRDGIPVQQRGYENARAVVEWAKVNFDYPLADLVISGCSAGSLGTQCWVNTLLDELTYEHAAVVVDSYIGVFPEGIQGPLMYQYGLCGTGLLSADLQAACDAQTLTIQDVFSSAMVANPTIGFANLDSKSDVVQRLFYAALAVTEQVEPYSINGSEFENGVNVIQEGYNKQPNYVSFLVTSSQHCYFPYSFMYTTDTSGKHGGGRDGQATLLDWTTSFPVLSGSSVSTQCSGEMLEPGDWSGDTYCDATQTPKTFSAP